MNINQVLRTEPACSSWGAAMGRRNQVEPDYAPEPLRLQRMRFVSGDYDTGGAYWGGGPDCKAVWCAFSTPEEAVNDTPVRVYVRGRNRNEAAGAALAYLREKTGKAWTIRGYRPPVDPELEDLYNGAVDTMLAYSRDLDGLSDGEAFLVERLAGRRSRDINALAAEVRHRVSRDLRNDLLQDLREWREANKPLFSQAAQYLSDEYIGSSWMLQAIGSGSGFRNNGLPDGLGEKLDAGVRAEYRRWEHRGFFIKRGRVYAD